MKKTFLLIGLLFLALLPAFIGIFHKGFFLTDDGNWMVIRLSAFYEALRQGQFPVRFLPRLNNGFGYPVADFLYPLFLYIGSFIHIFHIPYVLTVKILFALSLAVGAFGMFGWLRKQFGLLAGFAGGLVYTLFPYHMWDVTKRGSLGEVVALGIVPFVFWGIDSGNILLTGLGIGLLILAHNTLALLFLPVVLCYMLVLRQFKKAATAVGIGLGSAAFFWLPALFDKQYTVFDRTLVSNFSQYFLANELYTFIGIVSFVAIAFSLYLLFKKPENRPAFFLVVALLSISLTTRVSVFFWQAFHFGTYVQFPFRFLSLTALCVGFLAGYVVKYWKKEQRIVIAGLMIVLVYVSSWQFFAAKTYQYYPDTFYSTNQDSTTVHNEYMPVWVKSISSSPHAKIQISSGSIENITDRGSTISFRTNATQSAQVIIATVYFPGWEVQVDQKPATITPDRTTGFITLPLSKGEHSAKVFFAETPVRIAADSISLLTLLGILAAGIFVLSKKKKYANH